VGLISVAAADMHSGCTLSPSGFGRSVPCMPVLTHSKFVQFAFNSVPRVRVVTYIRFTNPSSPLCRHVPPTSHYLWPFSCPVGCTSAYACGKRTGNHRNCLLHP
jgi:hypothetical protein